MRHYYFSSNYARAITIYPLSRIHIMYAGHRIGPQLQAYRAGAPLPPQYFYMDDSAPASG